MNTEIKQNTLYTIFCIEFDKWEKKYNPSNCFIEDGRTIPYDFNQFCLTLWNNMLHQRGTWFELFREQMLNTAKCYQNNLKDTLWEVVHNFNINSI